MRRRSQALHTFASPLRALERDFIMPSHFNIRPATPNDADVIAEHRARMFDEMGEVPPGSFEMLRTRCRDRLREALSNGEYIGWLAIPASEPNVIAGGAGVQLRQVLPHPLSRGEKWIGIADGRHATVLNVFTDPEWRRQGVAQLLMNEIIEWSRAENLDGLVLHASEAGRTLYEGLGFTATNEMRFTGD